MGERKEQQKEKEQAVQVRRGEARAGGAPCSCAPSKCDMNHDVPLRACMHACMHACTRALHSSRMAYDARGGRVWGGAARSGSSCSLSVGCTCITGWAARHLHMLACLWAHHLPTNPLTPPVPCTWRNALPPPCPRPALQAQRHQEAQRNAYATLMPLALPAPNMTGPGGPGGGYADHAHGGAGGAFGSAPGYAAPGFGGAGY